ncbi:MAG: alpha/beta hydrolase [Pseudobutyrivibrio sp.]|nr:alpha/beta hydrolase [Pseudobutyrivibrio sp.]
MKMKKHLIWDEAEYNYPVLETFRPNIMSYIHDDDDEIHPAMIIAPGGAYCYCSASEGELVAKEVFGYGYNVFVLSYTTDYLRRTPLKMQPLKDLSRAICFVRSKCDEFKIDVNQVAVMGFSAGGHLVGSIAVHFDEPALVEKGKYAGISNRPDAVILSYPVITMGEYTHEYSKVALCGVDASEDELEYMSLEKQVKPDTPPVFIWHCETDQAVPVDNTKMFAESLKKNHVPVEMHLFDHGRHGMSTATEEWANDPLFGLYTMDQFFEALRYMHANDMELPEPINGMDIPKNADVCQIYVNTRNNLRIDEHGDPSIHLWVEMAFDWLDNIFE